MLRIGKAINALLSANTAITDKVGTKIFPVLANEDCKLPFIVYKRTSITPSYTKDGLTEDEGLIQINVLSEDYSESIDLVQAVRDSLELQHGVFAGLNIRSIRLDSANETGDENTFIQELNFKITIQ